MFTLTFGHETTAEDTRVALTPEAAAKLIKKFPALSITTQAGAGEAAGFPDSQYTTAGVKVLKEKDWAAQSADILLRITATTGKEKLPLAKSGHLIGLNIGSAKTDATKLELAKLPRTSRAQAMDVLSSQANLAGYAAVLLATQHLPRLMPMLMTAAGSSRPAQVLVLGVGVAGLQAIATARRLGAQVTAFDVRPEVQEQIQSLGAKSLKLDVTNEGQGGYAGKLTAEQTAAQQQALIPAIQSADVVITTAQIPGAPAPILVTEEAAKGMKPAAVLVDMAAAGYNRANGIKGGNCPLSVAGGVVKLTDSATIIGPVNLASQLAGDASRFWAQNMVNLLGIMLKAEGETIKADTFDELLTAMKVS